MLVIDLTSIENNIRIVSRTVRSRMQSVCNDLYSMATVLFIFCVVAIGAIVGLLTDSLKSRSSEFIALRLDAVRNRMPAGLTVSHLRESLRDLRYAVNGRLSRRS